ncbi:MAG: hypothetical protein AUH07_05285 [Gemmatimonadetes bacterium 13_2_20CM_70_9]|nr:MAG: hypothetical protein AUH07_05285 [Gemmatimonadetes bacterium 13_2_20CM_70_9]
MTTRAILVPVAAALVLVACREPASPASSSSPSSRPAFAVGGGQSGLRLDPGGLGEQSFAKWESHEGEPDAKGNADQALYFQKMVATPVFAAGFAVIDGLQGQPATALTALSWDHRADGWCGAGAPRWNVGVTDASGDHTVFLGCNAATHSPGATDGWTSDSYSLEDIAAAMRAVGVDPEAATISSLAILFDEGTDVGPGFVFLDNITVNTMVWTSPSGNSN